MDDGAWPRFRLPQPGTFAEGGPNQTLTFGREVYDTALVLARARFEVKDPARMKACRLSLVYGGGVVVRAARKTVFSGRRMVGSDQPIKGLKATVGDLGVVSEAISGSGSAGAAPSHGTDGGSGRANLPVSRPPSSTAKIPASAVLVRYAVAATPEKSWVSPNPSAADAELLDLAGEVARDLPFTAHTPASELAAVVERVAAKPTDAGNRQQVRRLRSVTSALTPAQLGRLYARQCRAAGATAVRCRLGRRPVHAGRRRARDRDHHDGFPAHRASRSAGPPTRRP